MMNLMFWTNKKIFLDYASSTPVSKEVLEVMRPYESDIFYNASSIYEEGRMVRAEIEREREEIAKILGATSSNILFTSGGTASNYLALSGVEDGHFIIAEDSHPSILDSLKGKDYSIWRVGEPLPFKENTVLVSAQATNNKLGRLVREERKRRGGEWPLLHVDATQSFQYFNIGLESLSADLITLDSGKIYGPKGIGALVIRRGVKLNLPPQGTLPTPLIMGFSKALKEAFKKREFEFERLQNLADKFALNIRDKIPQALVSQNLPNQVLVSIPEILPEMLVLALEREGVLVSAGPACESNRPEPKETPVRFSLGRDTTEKELNRAIKSLCRVALNIVK